MINWVRKKWSKKDEASGTSGPAITLSPDELALKNLNRLLSKGLIQDKNFREYYFELSDIFRRYLGSRYSFPAIDWTTEEISSWLHNCHSLDENERQKAQTILNDTDQIKFAKGETDPETCMKEMHSIEHFINLTKKIEIAQTNTETERKTEALPS